MNAKDTTDSAAVSAMRLYGSAIGIVSGIYSLLSAISSQSGTSIWMGPSAGLGSGGWIMALLGVVVLLHGLVLLTPMEVRFRSVNGPLMIGYSIIMLLNQVLMGTVNGFGMTAETGMNAGMGNGMGSTMTGEMGWDLGMVALAILMLISGVIMTNRGSSAMGM